MKIDQGLDLNPDPGQDLGLDPGLGPLGTLPGHTPGQSIQSPTPGVAPGLVLAAVEGIQGRERGNATDLTRIRVLAHQVLTEEGILTFLEIFKFIYCDDFFSVVVSCFHTDQDHLCQTGRGIKEIG